MTLRTLPAALQAVDTAVNNYNTIRPHMSLHLKTPFSVHHSR